ncbi:MAG: membrane protein insertion efficiency factor YidD [Pseudomonadota bacterium]
MKSSGYNLRFLPLVLILIYQRLISPFIPPTCRFYPSCSTYALTAIKRYGLWKGGILSLIRISKCHPFHPGGYDPL